ncbi:anaerobic sulfatase maturase [Vibrio mediterranei]|uniref:anaerobic sulfatase maturase n=1 Tax=Vibrio mediterranei TaxID=689 RepID=UPI0017F0E118|nr:anaerobic sulfatase maturase [Vibrio mediterranei]NUW72071.1 anaerobic sulfatase maturase [Vibrio mediterranei]
MSHYHLNVPQYQGQPHAKFQALAKPIGAVCNINCDYCYYLDKKQLLEYPKNRSYKMSDEMLERYIHQYIQGQNTPEIVFSWHGGEPTLLGLSYFERIVELQTKYAKPYVKIVNDIQTNGLLINDKWCQFLAKHAFSVGLSIDGPEQLHNTYRKNRCGQGTFSKVIEAAEHLKRHGIHFATLTCVNNVNGNYPLEVYRFLRDEIQPSQIQFIPVVDRDEEIKWAQCSEAAIIPISAQTTSWSVAPTQWGDFLTTIFDEWMKQDFGKVHIPYFENFFGIWMGKPSSMCTLSDICGKGIAVEPNGDVYACDHYVHPEHKIGNIEQTPLAAIALSKQQMTFGFAKQRALPKQCLECKMRFACHGECPKNRIIKDKYGNPGLNYLCQGWQQIFHHVDPVITHILELNGIAKITCKAIG